LLAYIAQELNYTVTILYSQMLSVSQFKVKFILDKKTQNSHRSIKAIKRSK